ncbi:MAG: hypothetical protein JWO85_2643 [Candidatus Eremiobacteraeota bacterium]|nr:hypothetical protein [Candidatus Eremiobacteraeota bacterium]
MTRGRRGPDRDRPISARGRVALFEESRARADANAAEELRRQAELDEKIMAEVAEIRRLHHWLLEHWPIELGEAQRAVCPACERRMVVDRVSICWLFRCHVPGHPTKPINAKRFARFIASQLGVEDPTA